MPERVIGHPPWIGDISGSPEGAFPLHMRVWCHNGEKTLTYLPHLRSMYYEDYVEAEFDFGVKKTVSILSTLHVSLSPDWFRYAKPMFYALWCKYTY